MPGDRKLTLLVCPYCKSNDGDKTRKWHEKKEESIGDLIEYTCPDCGGKHSTSKSLTASVFNDLTNSDISGWNLDSLSKGTREFKNSKSMRKWFKKQGR